MRTSMSSSIGCVTAAGLCLALAACVSQPRGNEAALPPATPASMQAALDKGDAAVAGALAAKDPARLTTADKDGGLPLHTAAFRGDAATTKALLDAGADPNTAKADGWTALDLAAWKGHLDVARLLLDRGAKVDAKKPDGGTALHAAVMAGHKAVVDLLISRGADVNARKTDGWTPLKFAKDRPEIADTLRKHGAKE